LIEHVQQAILNLTRAIADLNDEGEDASEYEENLMVERKTLAKLEGR